MYLKAFLALAISATLVGCYKTNPRADSSKYQESLDNSELFSDCIAKELVSSGGASMTIVRCPNSSTSFETPNGKTLKPTVVIDGITYERKDK